MSLASAHNNRAVALHKLGRLHEALAGFNKAITLQPDYAEAHNNRGNALREAGRLDEALAGCDTAIALNPNYAVAHNNRGIILRQTGRLEAALSSYDTAIALLPENAEAYGNRGNALLDLRRPEQALASYDTAIALQPNYAEAHKGRGNALVDLERLEEALASYDQAIALRPDYAEAYSDRGRLLRTLQRPLEALSSFNRAIALKPADPATYLSRGELLRFEGRTDEAVASLEAGLAVDKLHGGCRLGACLAQLPIIYGSEAEVPLRRQRYIASLERLAAAVAEPVVMRSVAGVLGIPPFYLPYQGENDVAPQAMYGQMACRVLAETLPPARAGTASVSRRAHPAGHRQRLFQLAYGVQAVPGRLADGTRPRPLRGDRLLHRRDIGRPDRAGCRSVRSVRARPAVGDGVARGDIRCRAQRLALSGNRHGPDGRAGWRRSGWRRCSA